MGIRFKVFALVASLAMGSYASFSYNQRAYIGEQYYIFASGKMTDAYFNMYDYVGGTYKYQIKLNDQTAGINARADLSALRDVLEKTANSWIPVGQFVNESAPTTGWVYTGNTVRLWIQRN